MHLDDCKEYLRERLTPERYEHSLGVMEVMIRAAKLYRLDERQAMLAGLLHDSEKDQSDDYLLATIHKYRPDLLDELSHDCHHPVYLHGRAAACTLPRDLGIHDAEILDAIAHHAGDKPLEQMTKLNECLHVADVLAPMNDFEGQHKLDTLFFRDKDLNKAHLLLNFYMSQVLSERKVPFSETLANNMALLIKRIGTLPPRFFART